MSYLLWLLSPIPIVGTAVRYRATYYPRVNEETISLPKTPGAVENALSSATSGVKEETISPDSIPDLEAGRDSKLIDDASSHDTLGSPPTFFGVFKNVWKHEHFEGLMQGYLPHLLVSLPTIRLYVSPAFLPFVTGKYTIIPFNILYIYYLIAAYRLIVSPHKFKLAEPKAMFHLTFTEYERAHPFKLLQYCGLVLPFFLHLGFTQYLFWPISIWNSNRMQDPFYTPPGEEQPNWNSWMRVGIHIGLKVMRVGIHIGLIVAATLIWTPVQVVLTRLAIQPIHGPPNSEPIEERDVDKLADMGLVAAPSYLHLTTEQRPYLGFRDCFTRIIKEEGWGVLYRCWWLTMLGFLTHYLQ